MMTSDFPTRPKAYPHVDTKAHAHESNGLSDVAGSYASFNDGAAHLVNVTYAGDWHYWSF